MVWGTIWGTVAARERETDVSKKANAFQRWQTAKMGGVQNGVSNGLRRWWQHGTVRRGPKIELVHPHLPLLFTRPNSSFLSCLGKKYRRRKRVRKRPETGLDRARAAKSNAQNPHSDTFGCVRVRISHPPCCFGTEFARVPREI